MAQLDRWRGKSALVTGASSGIGMAVSRALVAAGVRVFGLARREERLVALADELGLAFTPVVGDMRDEASIRRAVHAAGPDILVNNAGLGHKSPLMSGQAALWREMLEVNVLGLCIATQCAIEAMLDRGAEEGHVVHISSMAAHRVPPGSGVYSATKYAVRSLTESLRQELHAADAPIRVTSISPAFVETEFAAKYHRSEAAAEDTYGQYRVLSAADVAEAVLYAVGQHPDVQVHDLLLRPRRQAS